MLNFRMVVKMRIMFAYLTYMQSKIVHRVIFESAKVDVLCNYWNKLQGKL